MDFSTLKNSLLPLETADESAATLSNLLTILTEANIEMIVYEAKLLQINTADSLEKCVDVIFEAAINNDSQKIFAEFCSKVFFLSVPVCKDSQKMITFKDQIFEKSKRKVENFLEKQTMKSQKISSDAYSCFIKLKRPIALFRF